MDKQLFRIDGILWDVTYGHATPFCPKDRLELDSIWRNTGSADSATILICEDCKTQYPLPRRFWEEQEYIIKKINSKSLKDIKVLNLDDEALPIAEATGSSKDNKFFVTAVLTESKVGQRLVVYAGEKGRGEKTQIFVEPDIKRMAFDQKDLHPTDVFLKLEGTFIDGTKSSFEKKPEREDKKI